MRATYRVQVRPGFDLDATAGLAGYLADLGASHLYSAPLLAATPGSEHGYDVVEHVISPQLGGEPARLRLVAALREHGLGLVVDIVPNHMGVARPEANPAWWDVLRHGRAAAHAAWFDIDWSRPRILIPVLADAGAARDLRVVDGELCYHEHRYPLAPGTGGGTPWQVHDRQHYELVDWRRGNDELNYRRFFAIADLAGLRVEDPAVFDATHREVLRWVAAGEADGIRVDHPDGLADPGGYLRRLRDAAPGAWLVVEKILEAGEDLPAGWPVDGTTGYDSLREVCGLFVDPAGEAAFTALQARLVDGAGWATVARVQKRLATVRLFGAELHRLERLAPGAGAVLGELASALPVYRTYLPDGQSILDTAFAAVDVPAELRKRLSDPTDELAVRFQQLSGAVTAKGVEDTATYLWTRFVALNEVGGDPTGFGVDPADFHVAQAARDRDRPATMTTLSTHDTKRGEDVRARLAVLSEVPREWAAAVERWTALAPLPDPSLSHLLWQTVAGTWPIPRERLRAYLLKAAREADASTSWNDPDAAFEEALCATVDRVYDDPVVRSTVLGFAARITPFGWSNSLGQKLVQLTMPGVPDVYQGTELWDDSLVDPDNRRPVDFAARRALLARLDGGWLPPVDATGAAKLLVVSRCLRRRRDGPAFRGYRPVPATGPAAGHVVAFDRGGVVAVATRLPVGLAARGGWGDTALELPAGSWTDLLTGAPVGPRPAVGAILARYPVALLDNAS